MVSSERRVGPDLKTTFRLYFSQAFLIRSLTPLTYGMTASGCENHTVMDFLGRYIRQQKQHTGYIFIGRRKRKSLPLGMYTAVKEYTGLNVPNSFETVESLKKDGVLFRVEKQQYMRCSSFCTYMDGENENTGSIQAFVVNPPLVILHPYHQQTFVAANCSSDKILLKS